LTLGRNFSVCVFSNFPPTLSGWWVGVFSFSLKIFIIYFLFLFFKRDCVSWFLIKKITLVLSTCDFERLWVPDNLFFSFFFTKHKNFTHTLHSNKIITATALYWQKELHYLFFVFGHWGTYDGGSNKGAWRGKRGRMFSKMMGARGETLVKRDSLPFTHMTRSNCKI